MQSLIAEYGIFAVAVLVFLEYLGIPGYPGGLCLPLVGVLVHFHYLSLPTAFFVCLAASSCACCATYWVCSLWNAPIQRFVDHHPAFRKNFNKAKGIIDRHGPKGLLVSRMMPVVRAMISIPAGLFRMSFGPYLFYSMLGSSVYILGTIWLGSTFLEMVA